MQRYFSFTSRRYKVENISFWQVSIVTGDCEDEGT